MNTIIVFDISDNAVDLASQLPDQEIWCKFNERFDVSSHGRVYDLQEQRHTVPYKNQGYLTFSFYKDDIPVKQRVHRAVLETFQPNPDTINSPFNF